MTSLSGNVFLLFVLLAPGFLSIVAFYGAGRLSRHDNQHGLLFDAAAFVAISVLLHLIGVAFLIFLVSPMVGCAQMPTNILVNLLPFLNPSQTTTCSPGEYYIVLGLYMTVVSIFGFSLGYLLIKKIEDGSIRLKTFHGAYYDIIAGKEEPVVLVDIMTTTSHANRFLIYQGFLEEVSLITARKINYICIIDVQRFLIKIKDDSVETADRKYFKSIDSDYFEYEAKNADFIDGGGSGPADAAVGRLIVPGERIANVVFRSFKFEKIDDAELDQLLREAPEPRTINYG